MRENTLYHILYRETIYRCCNLQSMFWVCKQIGYLVNKQDANHCAAYVLQQSQGWLI